MEYKFSSYRCYDNENNDSFVDTSVAVLISGGRTQLLDYFNEPIDDIDIWEKYEKPLRLNDEAAQKILNKISRTKNITEFQQLPTEIQKKDMLIAHNKGISICQLNRLTGVSKSIIERILKESRNKE